MQNDTSWFANVGIVPFNPDNFPDDMYEAAETTNIPVEENCQPGSTR